MTRGQIISFPPGFLWGTSTSAPQIETAYKHDFKGLTSKDGHILKRTISHEKRRVQDAKIISSLGNSYRLSLDWSRLQKKPFSKFDSATVLEYRSFLNMLKKENMNIMLTLHHFANPNWFVNLGSWESKESKAMFDDYVTQVADNFGELVDYWITINEPEGYVLYSRLLGLFPPYKKNIFAAKRALDNLAIAHKSAYEILKERYPEKLVSISKSTMSFSGKSLLGKPLSFFADQVYMNYVADKFFDSADFLGISYYGRIPFRPFPISEVNTPGVLDCLGKEHDKLWEYYPKGLEEVLIRFSKRYRKPIIITEHGICTDDDSFRERSIREHLFYAHQAIKKGVELQGYFHWSTFDNFEWVLGPSYRFGLYHVDYTTLKRSPKPSAKLYSEIASKNKLFLASKEISRL